MTIETVTQISDLNPLYPAAGDAKSEGDNHIRNIKTALKTTLPNLSGAMTASHTELNILDGATLSTTELNILDGATVTATELNILDGATLTTTELNHVDGVTSPIQAQLDAKAPLNSPALTGTPTAPTATLGTNTTQIATMAALRQAAFSAALPAGVEGQFLAYQGGAWGPLQAPNQIVRTEKTGAYTAVFADRSNLFDLSGTFTLSFTACATLGSGWYAYLRNIGSGTITLDPNGTETVDGLSTTTLHPGEVRIIQCDGSALRTVRLEAGSAGVMYVQDQKPTGTAGGNTVVGYQTHDLNTTVVNTLVGATLASNVVTLPAGTYRCSGIAAATNGNFSRLFIYNNTDASYLALGSGARNLATLVVQGQFTLAAPKDISLREWSSSAEANGFGNPISSTGQPEIYASLLIEKVA